MNAVGRPSHDEFAPHAAVYVAHVGSGDVLQLLATQIERTIALLRPIDEQRALHAYAPGKWTIKDTICHMSDTERILSYRVLRVARGDKTALPPFDQDEYVANAAANSRTLDDLLNEFALVRQASLGLLKSLPDAAWTRTGTASGFPVSVRGLVYMLAGHELHHYKILQERYVQSS